MHGNSLITFIPSSGMSRNIYFSLNALRGDGKIVRMERGEEFSIFKPLKASFGCDVSIKLNYINEIFSALFAKRESHAWNSTTNFFDRFFLFQQIFACRTHIDSDIVGCHQEINQIMFFLPSTVKRKNNKIKIIKILTFGSEASTCCLTSQSNLSTGNWRHL